ncbi:RNA replicase [Cowpea mottle virus]|uniref:RNA-directed RNA polymerase n=3 Tax=Cowpea mottle virus TaxID=12627 RepID=Q89801_9TOMB|nr:RNA replicase [Cowpea mottle virus]prf//2123377B RNA replicase [Cowpea mottle virus]
MLITPRTGSHKVRKMGHVNFMGNGKLFGVHNASLVNLRRGLLERVFYVEREGKLVPPPEPIPGIFSRLAGFKSKLKKIVGTHSRISDDAFVALYHGRRNTIYQNAVDSLRIGGVQRKDSYLSTFIKAEKIPIYRKPDPAPRVIQPRNPRYNVEVGRYLRPFEHHLYRGIDEIMGGPTVIKGYDVNQIGNIMEKASGQFVRPVAVGFDMSRFDQHVSFDALQFEHGVYLQHFGGDRFLAKLLSWQLNNKGFANLPEGKVKYTRRGCRMSGDMNTAMGNCLLACAITWDLMKGIKYRLLNNGDDCVVITESKNVDFVCKQLERFRDYGFTCIAEEPVYELEKLEFCNLHPLYDGSSWTVMRKPSVSLAKDTYCVAGWNNTKDAASWLNAIGQCGAAITGGIPIQQAYYQCLIRNFPRGGWLQKHHHTMDSGLYWLALKKGRSDPVPVAPEARHSFYLTTGVTPDAQIAVEEYYNNLHLALEFEPEVSPTSLSTTSAD